MIDSKQRYLWRTLLMKYFTNKDYTNMNIANSPVEKSNDPNEKELWMVAINDNCKYSIIHIALNQAQGNIEYLENMSRMLQDAVGFNVYVLNINLFESENTSFMQGESICLIPDIIVEEKIKNEFKDIDKLLFYSQDVDSEINNQLKEVKDLLKSKIKNYRKKTNTPVFGKLFVITAIICLAAFTLINVYSNTNQINSTSVAIAFGAYYKSFISVLGQYWRFLTSGFLHVEFIHLFCNLYALFNIGRIVERDFGTVKAFIVMIAGIIFGNIFVFIGNDNVCTLGLSGGITALFGALVASSIIKGYLKDKGFRNNLIINLVINIAISLLPSVSWLAHLGGLIIGGFFGIIFCAKTEASLKRNSIIALIIGLVASIFFVSRSMNFNDYFLSTDKQVLGIYQDFGIDCSKDLDKLITYYLTRGN